MKRRILTIGLALAICLCGYAFIYGEESSKVDTEANTNQKEQNVEVKENAKPELSEEDMVDNTKEALEFNVEEPTAEEFNKDGKAPLLKSPAETRRNEWVTENGDTYYLDENGEKVKGVYAIDGTIYYFDPETGAQIVRTGWIDWSMHRYFSNATGELYHDMIITFGRDWYYMGSDGSAQIGIVKASNGNIYYADETGLIRKETGWIEENGKRYFSNANGELYHDMIITFGSDWYYMGADGAAMTGTFTTKDGRVFEADETGLIERNIGWKIRNGKRYFYSSTGELYRNMIITFGSDWYYMGSDGSAETGIVKASNGNIYYADWTGLIRKETGWIEENGKRYFSNANGELYRNMFITFGSDRYYMGDDGSVQRGIYRTIYDKIYISDSEGLVRQKTGWIEQNGKRYFSSATGEIYHNMFISFGSKRYYMGEDGSVKTGMYKTKDGKIYYSDWTGLVRQKEGWIEQNGKRYFSSATGEIYHNMMISFGRDRYFMGDDGSVKTGIIKIGNRYYYADWNGLIRNEAGWIEENGKRYFSNANGELYHSMFISFGSDLYYMGDDCAVIIGKFVINGIQYISDKNGLILDKSYIDEKTMKGIDVSQFNGHIDWKRVADSGIKFAFIRLGGRYSVSGSIYDDSRFLYNISQAKAYGIKVGVYFFTQAITENEAIEEARYTINKIRSYNLDLPIVIDTESVDGGGRHSAIGVESRTGVIKAFCNEVIKNGFTPMIYASTSWLNSMLNMSKLSNFMVWVAQWAPSVDYKRPYKCWQYTNTGRVNGINGYVDMDIWYN